MTKLKVGALAAVALGLSGTSGNARLIKLTVDVQMSDDPQYIVGVYGPRELPLISRGSFQFLFDESKGFGPTTEKVVSAQTSISYGVGEFLGGGFGNWTYQIEILALPTFVSYDVTRRALYFGSYFQENFEGAPCRNQRPQQSHCGAVAIQVLNEGYRAVPYGGWNIDPGAYPIFPYYSFRVDAIPEPASWAFMIAGFGLLGTASRRHPRARTSIA